MAMRLTRAFRQHGADTTPSIAQWFRQALTSNSALRSCATLKMQMGRRCLGLRLKSAIRLDSWATTCGLTFCEREKDRTQNTVNPPAEHSLWCSPAISIIGH